MRVLVVTSMYPPQHLGGYELVVQGAVGALRAAGHSVSVLTTDTVVRADASEEDPGVERSLRWWWRDHAFPRRSLRERWGIERGDLRTLRAAAAECDVVLWWAMGGLPLSLLASVSLPSVAFVHDDWLVYGPRVDQSLRARLDLSRVGEWVFVSDFTRRRALGALPAGARTSVAPSGIDEAYLGPAPERAWGGRLLVAGRIDERKGIDTAIDALAELPDATLTIAGGGDEAHLEQLRVRFSALGAENRTRFLGALDRDALIAAYDDYDALLFPVRWDEPWGLVPLEAMARGRPVIATGRGGSGEYLRDRVNCLLVPAEDPPALAAAVRRLAAEPHLRDRLVAGGLSTARAHTATGFHEAVLAAAERAYATTAGAGGASSGTAATAGRRR